MEKQQRMAEAMSIPGGCFELPMLLVRLGIGPAKRVEPCLCSCDVWTAVLGGHMSACAGRSL